jgi:hypothetical protein
LYIYCQVCRQHRRPEGNKSQGKKGTRCIEYWTCIGQPGRQMGIGLQHGKVQSHACRMAQFSVLVLHESAEAGNHGWGIGNGLQHGKVQSHEFRKAQFSVLVLYDRAEAGNHGAGKRCGVDCDKKPEALHPVPQCSPASYNSA